MSAADSLKSTGNRVLDELLYIMISRFEHLVERGFLAPHFLNKMIADPTEILKFLRQNRAVVGDQLNRRLNPSIRPTPQQLEEKGIVPAGYFTHGHAIAMQKKHRRRSTAGQDLAMMIQLRPKPQDIINKGLAKQQEMEEYIDIQQDQDQEAEAEALSESGMEENINNISIISRLLFATISEALKRSCADTTAEEQSVLCEMQEMNHEMKVLRDTLDKYFLSATPDISLFQEEEDMVRDKFHGIQSKLLHISTKQNNIHEKLKILHSVERGMIALQNLYDKQMSELQRNEEKLLTDLRQLRLGRDKAMAIMLAERSHRDWAHAKLTYTMESFAKYEPEDGFAGELSEFLSGLQQISAHQKQIVADYDLRIEELEQTLMRIRHDEGKVRNMTFKKIYDLHKQVQIAESLEFGLANRRLSVATATELEKERNHSQTKIHRQLSVLNNYPLAVRPDVDMAALGEMVEIQSIMADAKLKAFFSVFIQIFNQTVCDIELMFRNLNSSSVRHLENGVTTKQHLDKITNLCMSLYGIDKIVNSNAIEINNSNDANMSLRDKLSKCMRFINELKRAVAKEEKKKKKKKKIVIGTYRLNVIIIYVARKLCVNQHMVDEIERTHDQQVPRLAIIRCNDIFQAILTNQKIFDKKPKNIKQAAAKILENVFGILIDGHNDSGAAFLY